MYKMLWQIHMKKKTMNDNEEAGLREKWLEKTPYHMIIPAYAFVHRTLTTDVSHFIFILQMFYRLQKVKYHTRLVSQAAYRYTVGIYGNIHARRQLICVFQNRFLEAQKFILSCKLLFYNFISVDETSQLNTVWFCLIPRFSSSFTKKYSETLSLQFFL